MMRYFLTVRHLLTTGTCMASEQKPLPPLCRAASVEWFAEECKRSAGDIFEPTGPNRRMITIKQPVCVGGRGHQAGGT